MLHLVELLLERRQVPIEFLDDSSGDSPGEVPWLKDFIRGGGDYQATQSVLQVNLGLRGALVLTPKWKAFAFKGSSTYANLAEALFHYERTTQPLAWLIACGTESGKLRLAIDTDLVIGYWEKEGDNYYQKSSDGDGGDTPPAKNNPLLASPIPPNRTTERTTSPRTAAKAKSS